MKRQNDRVMKVSTTIKIADTEKEINVLKSLVYKRYCIDLEWHNPDDFPQKIHLDKYDPFGTFILIFKDGKPIGGTRFVRDSQFGFPHEKDVDMILPTINDKADKRVKEKIEKLERSKIMEVTKTVGTSLKNVISKDLAKAMYWYGILNDIECFFMVIDMAFFLQCHKLGAPVLPIGPPGYIEGSWTVPSVMFTDEIKSVISQTNPPFWNYIKNETSLVGDWGFVKHRKYAA